MMVIGFFLRDEEIASCVCKKLNELQVLDLDTPISKLEILSIRLRTGLIS